MSNNLPSTRRLGDLIDDVADKRLIIRPLFQRRQVWNNADKEKFIDTILKGYPFPEVFIAGVTAFPPGRSVGWGNWAKQKTAS